MPQCTADRGRGRGLGPAQRSEADNILREFPTPVILDQARERGLCAGKSAMGFQKLIVMCLIRSFRAERRARIDRGDRDLEFEPRSRRILT